ncbi:DNA-binding FadR family transcriptional regulator [Labrenzia sp. EL_159]|nr:DNA-binding FadR family transcriptional regulator [Labrenzia sp. EL_162]MBG6198222.1 DNA-binding FadR family transcriptional regulator [Labrenzia sp. EL_159]
MSRKSSESVLTELRQLLADLAPDAGDRLPAERVLSMRLGCSRETLRKGLSDLEKEGEIWRNVGQGTFRGARPRHLPVRDTLLLEGATPPDLMRARILLEPQVAAEAARRADAADIAILRKLVAEGRKAADRTACEQIDDAFHRTVALVSRNPILIGFLTYLSGARRRAAWQKEWDRTYRRLGADEFRTAHGDQHENIVNFIASADAISASSAMADHLETVEAAMSPGRS